MFWQPASTNMFDDPLIVPDKAPQFSRTEAFYCQPERILVLQVAEERKKYLYIMFSPLYGIRAAVLARTAPKMAVVYLTRDRINKDLVFKELEYDEVIVQRLLDRKRSKDSLEFVHFEVDGPQLFVPFTSQLQFVPYGSGAAVVRVVYIESYAAYTPAVVQAYFMSNPALVSVIYMKKELRKPQYEELVLEECYDDCKEALEQREDSLLDECAADPGSLEQLTFAFVSIHVIFRKRTADSVIHEPFPLPKFESCVFTEQVRRWIERKLVSALHYEFAFEVDETFSTTLGAFDSDTL